MLSIRLRGGITCATVLATVLCGACGDGQTGANSETAIDTEKPKYDFTRDFRSSHVDVWATHLAEFVDKPNVKALEIGSYEGGSAIWFLENILTHESASITCVDPFFRSARVLGVPIPRPDRYELRFDKNIEATGVPHKVIKIRAFSEATMRDLEMHSFDFVYIDGSHHAKDVMIDAVQAWSLIKVGGMIIFDDYNLKSDRWGVPLPAVDSFLDVFGPYIDVIHKEYQVIIRKRVHHLDRAPRTRDSSGVITMREG